MAENGIIKRIFVKVRRPCSLRASTYVDVFTMTMKGLHSILDYHPAARQEILRNARMLFPDINI